MDPLPANGNLELPREVTEAISELSSLAQARAKREGRVARYMFEKFIEASVRYGLLDLRQEIQLLLDYEIWRNMWWSPTEQEWPGRSLWQESWGTVESWREGFPHTRMTPPEIIEDDKKAFLEYQSSIQDNPPALPYFFEAPANEETADGPVKEENSREEPIVKEETVIKKESMEEKEFRVASNFFEAIVGTPLRSGEAQASGTTTTAENSAKAAPDVNAHVLQTKKEVSSLKQAGKALDEVDANTEDEMLYGEAAQLQNGRGWEGPK